jgi:hypothetical protein
LDQTLEVVRSELKRQAGRALAAAAVAVLVTMAGVVAATRVWQFGPARGARGRESSGDKVGELAPHLVVSVAAALLFLGQAARRTVQGRRVANAVQALRDGAGLAPGLAAGAGGDAGAWTAASRLTLNGPPAAHTVPVPSTATRWWLLMSMLLWPFPCVGTVTAAVALWRTYRLPGWRRYAAASALWLSMLTTVFATMAALDVFGASL